MYIRHEKLNSSLFKKLSKTEQNQEQNSMKYDYWD